MFFLTALVVIVGLTIFLRNALESTARAAMIGLALAVVVTFISSAAYAPTGQIKVITRFGEIQEGYVPDNGLTFINPIFGTIGVSIQREEVVHEDQEIRTGTADDNYLTVDVSMAYSVNAPTAWKVLKKIPNYKAMINRQADAALRQGISKHKWTEIVNNSDGKAAADISVAWKAMVESQLVVAGLTREEAAAAFTYYPVQIRKALPDQVVQDATAAKSAAQQQFETQSIITKIAGEIASRRNHEGDGINNLIRGALGLKEGEKLPSKLTVSDVALIVNAVSNLEKAGAIVKLSEDPKRALSVILNGGDGAGANSNPVSVNAGTPVGPQQ